VVAAGGAPARVIPGADTGHELPVAVYDVASQRRRMVARALVVPHHRLEEHYVVPRCGGRGWAGAGAELAPIPSAGSSRPLNSSAHAYPPEARRTRRRAGSVIATTHNAAGKRTAPFTVHTPYGGCFACSPCLPPPVVGRGRTAGAAAGQRLMGRRPVGVAGAEGRQLERAAGRSRCV
jgi:hypothetical protein